MTKAVQAPSGREAASVGRRPKAQEKEKRIKDESPHSGAPGADIQAAVDGLLQYVFFGSIIGALTPFVSNPATL